MKKIAVAFLFCLTSTIANAQGQQQQLPNGFSYVPKQVLCGPSSVIFKSLADPDIDEKPVWLAQDESGTTFALFANPKTKAFTLVQFTRNVACVLGLGTESELLPQPEQKTPRSKIL